MNVNTAKYYLRRWVEIGEKLGDEDRSSFDDQTSIAVAKVLTRLELVEAILFLEVYKNQCSEKVRTAIQVLLDERRKYEEMGDLS